MLDAEPDVAAAGPEDGSDHHGPGGARLCRRSSSTRCGGAGRIGVVGGGVVLVLALGFWVSVLWEVVPERGAKASLGGGGGVRGYHGGGEEARREESTDQGVDLGHCG